MNQELYYTADNKLMAVEVSLGAEVKYGTPKELFAMSDRGEIAGAGYGTTRGAQRFLLITSAEEASVTPFAVVPNWMAEVRK